MTKGCQRGMVGEMGPSLSDGIMAVKYHDLPKQIRTALNVSEHFHDEAT